jgi:CheY-like chemotaxis protein
VNLHHTVLLVDDSENDLFLTRSAFKHAGYSGPLQEVHNGEEAIAYLKGEGRYSDRSKFPLPAVMLLDLNMPLKNGFDVLKWLRAQTEFKSMSVVVFSASMRTEDIAQAFELGANSFLVKPGALDEQIKLIRCLRDWLEYNHFPPLNDTVRR